MPHYRIEPADPSAHVFAVVLTIDAPDPAGQVLALPAWIPGSYLIRDFAKNVLSLSVESADGAVPVEQIDKQTWRVAPVAGPITVHTRIYAFDTSVRTAYLDDARGFFNGTSVCLRVVGAESQSVTVDIAPPPGVSDWRVATSMHGVDAERLAESRGFGRYACANYDELIDHPVELGTFSVVDFEAGGRPHAMALTDPGPFDAGTLAADLARVCDAQVAVFGELPADRYLFLNQVTADGYGGLEHRYSSALVSPRGALPAPGAATRTDDYVTFLGLVSHEYFHLWNVRRLLPAAVATSDLSEPAYFDDLWAYEGITSYYDDLALCRAGLIEPARYLDLLAKQLTRLERNAGRHLQSMAESSRLAWTKFYQQDANAPNAIVSYYNKGALVACGLDLALREASDGAVTLDAVMRRLWADYGRAQRPIPQDAVEGVAAELLDGHDDARLADYFETHVRRPGDVDLPERLARFGVRAVRRAATGADDAGGRASGQAPASWTGLTVRGQRQPRIRTVLNASPAERAGLAPGDRLVAIDGFEATPAVIAQTETRRAPGEDVAVHVIRGDRLLARTLTLLTPPQTTWTLEIDPDADADASARRTAWLGATA